MKEIAMLWLSQTDWFYTPGILSAFQTQHICVIECSLKTA